jgi:hypothetical protein
MANSKPVRKKMPPLHAVRPPWCKCCAVAKVADVRTSAKTPRKLASGEVVAWDISSGTLIQKNHSVDGKLCDFIVRCTRPSRSEVIVVELKSRVQGANDIVAQLQGGLDILQECNLPHVAAALFHNGRMGVQELRVLKSKKLSYRGKRVILSYFRSGTSLEYALK